MLLTKETGSVFLIALFVFEFFVFVRSYEKKPGLFLKRLALVCVPVAIASVSFIIQKIKFGWFFYPLHMGYIVSASMHFTETLLSAAAYVFIYYGRNGLSFFIIVSLILIFFAKRTAFLQKERRIITAVSFFIILQLVFCAVNFYIPRYLLCVFPLFCIVATVVIDKAFSNFKLIYPLIVTGLMITGIFFYTRPKASGDIDYSPSIITDLQMVRFFEQQHLSDAHIFTTCVLRYDLCEPYAGYLSGEKFRNVQSDFSGDTEYCVFSADENDLALFDKIKRENKLVLVQRFEKKYAWCEIYKVIR